MGEVKFYRMDFDEDALQMTELAVTSNPAIEITDGVMLNKDEYINLSELTEFQKDKQIIASVALVADKWIERKEKNGDSYFITFTPDQVRAFKNAFEANGGVINLNHTDRKIKAEILLSEIVGDGAEEKIRSEYGYNGKLSPTDYFVALKIENEDDWEYLKSNGMNSFSIQAYFKKNLIKFNKMSEIEKLNSEIEELKSKLAELEKVEEPQEGKEVEEGKEEKESIKLNEEDKVSLGANSESLKNVLPKNEEGKVINGNYTLEIYVEDGEITYGNIHHSSWDSLELNKEGSNSTQDEEEAEAEEETQEEETKFEVTETMYNDLIEAIAQISAKVDELGATPPVEEEMTEEVEMTAVQKTANFLKGFNK